MLQNIRDNSSSWVVKVIVGFIILTFSMFGLDAIVGAFTGGGDEVATVNDSKISRYELEIATQRQVRQILNQMGPDADPSQLNENMIRQQALQNLIDRASAIQAAKEGELAVSELQLDRLILATPEFRGPDGQFSPDQFNAMLRNVGLQPHQFRQELRKDVLINQLQGGVSLSEYLPEKYVKRIIALDSQTRDLTYVALNATEQADIKVTEDEVENYYQENTAEFRLPERVRLNFIRISQQDLARSAKVSEEELQQAYETYKQTAGNRADYYASHILLDTENRSEAEAVEQLQTLKERVEQGESFAELAKTHSDDIGSSAQGGQLGLVEPDSFDSEFEQALFALETGNVSDPVITDFGVHLVYLDRKETAEIESFSAMRDTLAEEIRSDKAARQYLALTEELANVAFASENLKVPAEELNLAIESTDFFSAEGGEGVAAHPKVIRAAFSDIVKDNRENSDLIELDAETSVVIRAAEVKEANIQPLDDVADVIQQKLILEKQITAVQEHAEALIVSAETASLSLVASAQGLTAETAQEIARVNQSLPQAVVQKAFSLSEGKVQQVVAGDTIYLVEVNAVQQPEITDDVVAFYRQAIRMSQSRHTVQQLRTAITEQAEVTRL